MNTEPAAVPEGEEPANAASTEGGEVSSAASDGPKRKIKIGSQRSTSMVSPVNPAPSGIRPSKDADVAPAPQPAAPTTPSNEAVAAPTVTPAESDTAEAAPPAEELDLSPEAVAEETSTVPTPEPVLLEPRADDAAALEAEIEAALGGSSIEDLLGESDANAPAEHAAAVNLSSETKVSATVIKVDKENVFFDLGGRNQGVTGLRGFDENPEVGSKIDVVVQKYNADEGLYEVHVPGASATVDDWGDIEEGMVVEARVTGSNTGGLECEVGHIRAFMPISQITLYRVENTEEFVGQKMQCVVSEANPARGNLVLSRRAVLEREREESREKTMQSLEVGQTHEGVVRKLMPFGAFVELAAGVDGLIHISQLSWDRVEHPSEVLSEGQKVEVRIEKFDPASGKIGLSYRELQDNPWHSAAANYPSGQVVKGTVSRIAQFGAFVKLEPGVEGLIHISELAHHRVTRVDTILKEGEKVEVKVLEVDQDAQRISLSLKAVRMPLVEEAKDEAEDDAPEKPRELAVPEHKGPLKGGTGKSSGGEQFGLKW